jgi:SAM-dependent methyltransferase
MSDTSYRTSHQMKDHGARYDSVVYGEGQYDANVWEIERAQLARIVQKYFPNGISNYLDFACGTGRILSQVAPRATQATGLDISAEMVKEARKKVQHAEYILGDITEDQNLLDGRGPFTGITMFRFLLNAEPALRKNVLEAIVPHLASEGIFICNNHGNQSSALALVLFLRRMLGLSVTKAYHYQDALALLEQHDLHVVETVGTCFLPRLTSRILPRGLWRWLELQLGKCKWLSRYAIYQIYVARKQEPTD